MTISTSEQTKLTEQTANQMYLHELGSGINNFLHGKSNCKPKGYNSIVIKRSCFFLLSADCNWHLRSSNPARALELIGR